MNVFDFDGTIYNGDSSIDFWIFCLKKNKYLLRYLPKQLVFFLLFFIKTVTKEEFKSFFFSFIQDIDINNYVSEFWNNHINKIKPWYIKIKQDTDCIISASPYFLLKEACYRLGIKNLISTNIDPATGQVIGKNCYGINKITLFKDSFPQTAINNFYSDSKTDIYLAKIADHAFFVKNNKIIEWNFYE